MNTIITENRISYVLTSDEMYYPALKYDDTEPHYGKYGLIRKRFLQDHHKGYYTALLLRGKLTEHLNQIDDAANTRMDFLVSQMRKQQHINETLKARNQLAWVRETNNIYKSAEEIVLNEIIHFNKLLPFSIDYKNT